MPILMQKQVEKVYISLYISAKIFFKIINTQMSTVALGPPGKLSHRAQPSLKPVFTMHQSISQKKLINLEMVNIAPGKVYTSCIMR